MNQCIHSSSLTNYYYHYYFYYYYYYYFFFLMLLLLGLDSSELITQLRAAHASGYVTAGLDVYAGALAIDWSDEWQSIWFYPSSSSSIPSLPSLSSSSSSLSSSSSSSFSSSLYHPGTIGDMQQLGIRESYKSKLQVLVSAAEAAEMILRVDDIIKCAPRQRQ